MTREVFDMDWQAVYRELVEEHGGERGWAALVCQSNNGRRIAMSPARGILEDLQGPCLLWSGVEHPSVALLEEFSESLGIPVFQRLQGDDYIGPDKTYKTEVR